MHSIDALCYASCGLLLQMSHVAWSVCVCVLGTQVICAKMGESIEIPFGELTPVDQENHIYITRGPDSPSGRGNFAFLFWKMDCLPH